MRSSSRRTSRTVLGLAASLAILAGGTSAALAAARPSRPAGSTLTGAAHLVAGYEGSCTLLHNGHVECWGDNSYGELGAGLNGGSSNVPITVRGLASATSLVSGYESYCALVRSGRVECWGDNAYGQLGAGMNAGASNVPLTVKGVTSATSLVSGYEGYCALLAGGRVDCWGDNAYGELGAGLKGGSSDVPVAVR